MELDLDQYPTTDGSFREDFYPYTIRDIYLGTYFERTFFSEILRDFLNLNVADLGNTLSPPPNAIEFEVSETLLRVWPNEDRVIQSFMDSWECQRDKSNTLVSRKALKKYLRDYRGITSTYGFTNVIELILKKTRKAFFFPEHLRELDSQLHVSYLFVELRHIDGNIFEYTPCYHTWHKKLGKKIHDLNLARYQMEMDRNSFGSHQDPVDSDQDFLDSIYCTTDSDFCAIREAEDREQDTTFQERRGVNLF